MYIKLISAFVIGNSLIWLLVNILKSINKREKYNLVKLFTISFTAILVLGAISYNTLPQHEKKNI